MAARRLLIIMVLLLAISTVAAALVPAPEQRSETGQSSSSTAAADADRDRRGNLVAARVATEGDPDRVGVSMGDQLSLVVTSRRAADVSVPAFGLTEFAEPGAPARFDLLIERPGRFDVTARGEGAVATIVARRAERQP